MESDNTKTLVVAGAAAVAVWWLFFRKKPAAVPARVTAAPARVAAAPPRAEIEAFANAAVASLQKQVSNFTPAEAATARAQIVEAVRALPTDVLVAGTQVVNMQNATPPPEIPPALMEKGVAALMAIMPIGMSFMSRMQPMPMPEPPPPPPPVVAGIGNYFRSR